MKTRPPEMGRRDGRQGAWGLIGLCVRAGQLVSGESGCEAAVRAGQAGLVLLDAGASGNLRKKFQDACAYRRLPMCTLDAGRLGQAIGKPGRMVAAVKAGVMADRLRAMLSDEAPEDRPSGFEAE